MMCLKIFKSKVGGDTIGHGWIGWNKVFVIDKSFFHFSFLTFFLLFSFSFLIFFFFSYFLAFLLFTFHLLIHCFILFLSDFFIFFSILAIPNLLLMNCFEFNFKLHFYCRSIFFSPPCVSQYSNWFCCFSTVSYSMSYFDSFHYLQFFRFRSTILFF